MPEDDLTTGVNDREESIGEEGKGGGVEWICVKLLESLVSLEVTLS